MSIGTSVQIHGYFIDVAILAIWAVITDQTAAMADEGEEELTNIAKYVAKLNTKLGKKQKDALNLILEVHRDSKLALDRARIVFEKLKNLCDDLIFILEDGSEDEDIKFAIKAFIDEGKIMEEHIHKAIDQMTIVVASATKG